MEQDWWTEPAMVSWGQFLLDSFRHWTGCELMERMGAWRDQAQVLFTAPFVVVSHGNEEDPVLNYGNRTALQLWEMTWEQFRGTPSRLTAEPLNRAERAHMLAQAAARGFIDNYRGVRISRTGRRFLMENAIVWNVIDADRKKLGQAAAFSKWSFLE